MPVTMPLGVVAVMLPELDFDQQIALCRDLGVTHYILRPRVIADRDRGQPYSNWGNHKFDLTPQRLRQQGRAIGRQLADAGLTAWSSMPGASIANSDDDLKVHFEGAAAAGARSVRVGPEGLPKGPFDYPALLDRTIARYQQVAPLARSFGVKVVIETHAASLAAGPALAWNICRHFDPADMGVMFDLPNFAREGSQAAPVAVALLKPYIDHLHVGGSRRVTATYDALGFRQVRDCFCPLPESDLSLPTWLAALRDAGLTPPLAIEDYTENLPGALRLADSVRAVRRVLEAL